MIVRVVADAGVDVAVGVFEGHLDRLDAFGERDGPVDRRVGVVGVGVGSCGSPALWTRVSAMPASSVAWMSLRRDAGVGRVVGVAGRAGDREADDRGRFGVGILAGDEGGRVPRAAHQESAVRDDVVALLVGRDVEEPPDLRGDGYDVVRVEVEIVRRG